MPDPEWAPCEHEHLTSDTPPWLPWPLHEQCTDCGKPVLVYEDGTVREEVRGPVSGNILDSIDGALRDWETSGDAMRWQPPEQQLAPPRGPVVLGTLYVAPVGTPAGLDAAYQPVEGLVSVTAAGPGRWTIDDPGIDETLELARARLRAAQFRAEQASQQMRADMTARMRTLADQMGVPAGLHAAQRMRAVMAALPRFDDLTPLGAPRVRPSGMPSRPLPSWRWWRYPEDGELVPRHVSPVCTGWLCGSCTDRSCAHTCHGGHLR